MQTAPHLEFVISSGDRFGKFVIYPSMLASGPLLSWPTEGILRYDQKKRALFTKFRIRVANGMHQHPFLQPLWDARSCPSVPCRWFRRALSGGEVGGKVLLKLIARKKILETIFYYKVFAFERKKLITPCPWFLLHL